MHLFTEKVLLVLGKFLGSGHIEDIVCAPVACRTEHDLLRHTLHAKAASVTGQPSITALPCGYRGPI